MAEYRIVCVNHAPEGRIESVGYSMLDADEGYDDIWTVEQARYAIEQGHRLYTVSPTTGTQADVELYEDTIRTNPDQSTDNNLDELPRCES
jgi:hypothetical protein